MNVQLVSNVIQNVEKERLDSNGLNETKSFTFGWYDLGSCLEPKYYGLSYLARHVKEGCFYLRFL